VNGQATSALAGERFLDLLLRRGAGDRTGEQEGEPEKGDSSGPPPATVGSRRHGGILEGQPTGRKCARVRSR
jgi:hypothetical protein